MATSYNKMQAKLDALIKKLVDSKYHQEQKDLMYNYFGSGHANNQCKLHGHLQEEQPYSHNIHSGVME